MKPPDRTTQRVTFRSGLIAFSAMTCLAVSLACEQRMGVAASAANADGVSSSTSAGGETNGTAVRPFHVDVPQEDLDDLRGASRRPDGLTRRPSPIDPRAPDSRSCRSSCGTGATDYDWRQAEAKLNAWPQFMTTIDGVDIHFIHVRSRHENALPLIISHGWPGSVFEQIKIIGPLTDPTAYGGRAEDAFDVVIPSLPGYGFSSRPTETGWDVERIGRAWDVLMKRLGYARYVSQGGDWGAGVVEAMGRQAPAGLLGHPHQLAGGIPARRSCCDRQRRARAGGTLRANAPHSMTCEGSSRTGAGATTR